MLYALLEADVKDAEFAFVLTGLIRGIRTRTQNIRVIRAEAVTSNTPRALALIESQGDDLDLLHKRLEAPLSLLETKAADMLKSPPCLTTIYRVEEGHAVDIFNTTYEWQQNRIII